MFAQVTCTNMHTYMHSYVNTQIHVYVHIEGDRMRIHMCVCRDVYMKNIVQVCVYMYTCAHVYVYMHVHIHMHGHNPMSQFKTKCIKQ